MPSDVAVSPSGFLQAFPLVGGRCAVPSYKNAGAPLPFGKILAVYFLWTVILF